MTVDDFIARWTGREGGAERANYQMFLAELGDVLGVPRPDPAGATTLEQIGLISASQVRPGQKTGTARYWGICAVVTRGTSPRVQTKLGRLQAYSTKLGGC